MYFFFLLSVLWYYSRGVLLLERATNRPGPASVEAVLAQLRLIREFCRVFIAESHQHFVAMYQESSLPSSSR